MTHLGQNIFIPTSNCDMKTRCEIDTLAKELSKNKPSCVRKMKIDSKFLTVTVGYLRITYVYTWRFPETRILSKMGIAAEEGCRHISISFSMHVHIFSLRVENSLFLSFSLTFSLSPSLFCYVTVTHGCDVTTTKSIPRFRFAGSYDAAKSECLTQLRNCTQNSFRASN